MFASILIANRGEIACRVIRTARRMGIRTVAVYSDADADALHVTMADEAYRIGPPAAAESYLNIEAIVEAARRSGAEAIHPGYGFLAENDAFAEACANAGLAFIGPPPEAIRAMGSKSAAKMLMERAGVPLVPGYHGDDQAPETLLAQAEAIGFPVLIKASAGGGGKGMRVVRQESEFPDLLAAARRESAASFGDDRVLLEKYLERPRHVEIQVFADTHGNVVYLFERDCSIQRRYQKVIEEAPAPGVPGTLRETMGEAAVAAARAIGYVGAGTVEFLLDETGAFYFMEMNTRLQVEHPVTEMITGVDLVEWQFKVAAGEPLPLTQGDLVIKGHAFEARIYAEEPSRHFVPSVGTLTHLRFPSQGPDLRVETGVREGDEVTVYYDPMIAKVVVWGEDRATALRRLSKALADTQVTGVVTNASFLARISALPSFAAGEIDTGFIERHRDELFRPPPPASDRVLALATLELLLRRVHKRQARALSTGDPYSPWNRVDGWRLNLAHQDELHFLEGEEPVTVKVSYLSGQYRLDLREESLTAEGSHDEAGDLIAVLNGVRVKAMVVRAEREVTVFYKGAHHTLTLEGPGITGDDEERSGGWLTAPMPGKIVAVLVQPGERVDKGQPLIILEAMKMEQTVFAPREGVVGVIHYHAGALVKEGAELLTFVEKEE